MALPLSLSASGARDEDSTVGSDSCNAANVKSPEIVDALFEEFGVFLVPVLECP